MTISRNSLVGLLGSLWMVGCGTTIESDPSSQTQAPIVGEACDTNGATHTCGANAAGVMTCADDGSGAPTIPKGEGKLTWSSCVTPTCVENATRTCTRTYNVGTSGTGTGTSSGGSPETVNVQGTQTCERNVDDALVWGDCIDSSASTPLVFSFDGASAKMSDAPGAFDLSPSMSVATDWPSASTPWLALDRNHNGNIDDGGELFGSATRLSVGSFAANGFAALAELDTNHDGRISAADSSFSSLVVWRDDNQDRKSQSGELMSLSSLGIESIELGFVSAPTCDTMGNCEIEASSFVYVDTSGARHAGRIADVHLRHH